MENNVVVVDEKTNPIILVLIEMAVIISGEITEPLICVRSVCLAVDCCLIMLFKSHLDHKTSKIDNTPQ